jgi:hypothetical protein
MARTSISSSRGLVALIALLGLPGTAQSGSPAAYHIEVRDVAGDFDAPVARVEDVTFDVLVGRWCFVNDSATSLGCADGNGTPTQTVSRSDFEAYLASEGVANPQLYVGETEIVGYDAQGDGLYVVNNVNAPTLCSEPGTVVQDLPALYRLTRSSPADAWTFSDFWLLPSMNDCPGFPPLVFHYAGIIAVDGVVFFHTDKTYTSAGGESVVKGIYEFDLGQNDFVDLNTPAFAYDTSGGFVAPRRIDYDALEGQAYVMEYSSSSLDEMRVLQIDWASKTAVIENDLIDFGQNPPVSGFLHASRGAAVDSASNRIRIGNNDSTDPNTLLFVMTVPEPGSTTLLLFGIGGLAVAQRVRRRVR